MGHEENSAASFGKKIQATVANGLNPALLKVARMLSDHDPTFRRNYMLGLPPTGKRQVTDKEVDRAISQIDGTASSPSGNNPKRQNQKKITSHWPTPDPPAIKLIMRTLKKLHVTSEKDTAEKLVQELKDCSPNGHDHTVSEFIDHAFEGIKDPIYLGNKYHGGIIFPEEFLANKDVIPDTPTHFLPNTMKRKLTEWEIENGNHRSGGRENKFANDKLAVITIESDTLSLKNQLAVILFLATHIPLCFVVDSSGKSYHATFSLKGVPRKIVDEIRQIFADLGGDPALLKPVQLSRLGGAIREGTKDKQRVLYMDSEARHRRPDPALLSELVYLMNDAKEGQDIITSSLKRSGFAFDTYTGKAFFSDITETDHIPSIELDTNKLEQDPPLSESDKSKEFGEELSFEEHFFPSIVSTSQDIILEARDRRLIIEGLLRVGHKSIFTAPSKAGKTWAMINLALQVESGGEWLGFKCHRVPVLFLNFEILPDEFTKRVRLVQKASGLTDSHSADFDVFHLRDRSIPWEDLTDHLTQICAEREQRELEPYGLIILDPIYKLLGDTDENSNGGVGMLLAALGRMASKTRTAVMFSHHHSKGGKNNVPILDRMSGAGCWARDPDLIMDLTEHEEKDCYTVEAVPRSFKKPHANVVKQKFPIFEIINHLDPTNLRKAGGSAQIHTVGKVVKCFDDKHKLPNAELLRLLERQGMGKTTAKKLVKEAEEKGVIESGEKNKGRSHTWRVVEHDQPDLVIQSD